jgi:hypothetical protein
MSGCPCATRAWRDRGLEYGDRNSCWSETFKRKTSVSTEHTKDPCDPAKRSTKLSEYGISLVSRADTGTTGSWVAAQCHSSEADAVRPRPNEARGVAWRQAWSGAEPRWPMTDACIIVEVWSQKRCMQRGMHEHCPVAHTIPCAIHFKLTNQS